MAAFKVARRRLPVSEALKFAGYVASHRFNGNGEVRDLGGGRTWRGNGIVEEFPGPIDDTGRPPRSWRQPTDQEKAERYWQGAVHSGHRYAKGIHGDNYGAAGRRLISAAIRRHGPLSTDVEPMVNAFENGTLEDHAPLVDALQEHHPEAAAIFEGAGVGAKPGRLSRRARAYGYVMNF